MTFVWSPVFSWFLVVVGDSLGECWLLAKTNKQKLKCDSEVILCPKFNPKTFPKEKFPNSFSFYLLNLKLCDSMKKMKVKMKEVHWWFCIVGFHTYTHTHAQRTSCPSRRKHACECRKSCSLHFIFLLHPSGTHPHPQLPLLWADRVVILSCQHLSRSTTSVWAGALYLSEWSTVYPGGNTAAAFPVHKRPPRLSLPAWLCLS